MTTFLKAYIINNLSTLYNSINAICINKGSKLSSIIRFDKATLSLGVQRMD